MKLLQLRSILLMIICLYVQTISAQIFGNSKIHWTKSGTSYLVTTTGITQIDLINHSKKDFITRAQLTPKDSLAPLKVEAFQLSDDDTKVLIFTNTAKVWRYHTRGDYWVFDLKQNKLFQIGKNKPEQSLMFAKFSPNGEKVAYVSEHNLFSENIISGKITQLTFDGTRKFINGTFDWVYEEELGCRDGFRWSPDGNKIAFWQVDGTATRDYYMLNTTDSVYSHVVPVEYPKVGQPPSPVRIGVININTLAIQWMKIDGDPQQHYLPRMEWAGTDTLVVQQLNRKQQESKLIYCNATTGISKVFYTETDTAFIEIKTAWNDNDPTGWDWINNQRSFIWVSEKDGWRHLYKIDRDGKETLLTNGKYDIASVKCIDEANNIIYFMASPDNATQLYLYKINMDGKSKAQLVSAASLAGMHNYDISPTGKFAWHTFGNHNTEEAGELISLPDNKPVNPSGSIASNMKMDKNINVEYTQVTTEDGITVDAWINKPANFDKKKKYPVVLYVYGEPWSSTVEDSYGGQQNFLYNGNMSADGYIQIAVDNRGSPSLKGAAWRKSIYRKIGVINIRDMAMATKKLLELPYMDRSRVAVWGWSGGGSSTLNLMFQYPAIFKTGISIAAITNELYYDNIYTERYMGLPQENMQDFINASAVTYAKNLQGNLLYIHGTGDDNVHYDNAEALINELVKYDKQFQFMAYPNRTHSISEGAGTRNHLSILYTNFLQKNCPAGGRLIK